MSSNDESETAPLYGGIEAGGTKFVCAVGTGPEDVRAETRIPTTEPGETLAAVRAFFEGAENEHGRIAALGVGSFGPVDVSDPSSSRFGQILATPKPGWSGFPLLRRILDIIGRGIPATIDTDVNAAVLGEREWGTGRGFDDLVYITVGTGIGGGALVAGRLLHGINHPEMGHLRIPHDPAVDPFSGCCPFHGDCLEGLASGPALERRYGIAARELGPDHEAWQLEASYLAGAAWNITLTLSPAKIIFGGGVMEQQQLLPLIRSRFRRLSGDYLEGARFREEIDSYLVPPGLGGRSGILGALALAKREREEETPSAGSE